jgi:hypothetical protein
MCEDRRKLDLEPLVNGMYANSLVAPSLVCLTVGAEEQPSSLPPPMPLGLGKTRRLQVMASSRQPAATSNHRYLPTVETLVGFGQSVLEHLQPSSLLPSLRRCGVPTYPAIPAANWSLKTLLDDTDCLPNSSSIQGQIP